MRQNPRRNCRRRSGGWLLGDGWCHELSTRLSTRRVKPCTFKRLLLNSHVLPTIFLAEAPCSESIYVRISIDRPKDTAQPAYPPYPHMWPHPSLSVWVRAPTIVLKILRKLPKGGGSSSTTRTTTPSSRREELVGIQLTTAGGLNP